MRIRTFVLSAVTATLALTSALEAAGIGEQSVLRVDTPAPVDALTSQATFYPGEEVTLTVTGQIDANHEQWEEDECHWLDIFKWFCDRVRRHRSHVRPQSQVGALLQIVGSPGSAPWAHGTPPNPVSSTFTSSPQHYFEPGKSGQGWSYVVAPSGASATFTVTLAPSTPSASISPVRLKAFIGDRIAGGERLTYDDCGPIRMCSAGALTIVLKDVVVDQRLQQIATYLSAERDLATVTGPHLFDHWVQLTKPSEAAHLLLAYANQFHPLAGESTEEARREILDFALGFSSVAKLNDNLLDTLRRERVLFHVEAGNLDVAIKEIRDALPTARSSWSTARDGGAEYPEKRTKGVSYIRWLIAAASAYPKQSDQLNSKDVRSAVALLASANEILAELIAEAPGGRDVELEREFAHNSVTNARLLTLLRGHGELREATQVIDRARAYFPRIFDGALTHPPAADGFLLLEASPPQAQEKAEPFEERTLPAVGWQIISSTTSRDHAFARRGQRFAQLRFEDDAPAVQWLDSPASTGDLIPVAARPLSLIVADAKGRLWRLTPGQPGATALLDDGATDRRVIASPTANAALVLGADGKFLLVTDLDRAADPSGARTGEAGMLHGVELAAIAPYGAALAGIAWIAPDSGKLQVSALMEDGDTGARLAEEIACSGKLPPDLSSIHLSSVAGDATKQAVLLVGRSKLARALVDGVHCKIEEIALSPETLKTAGGPWKVWPREDGWLLAPDGRAAGAALIVRTSGGVGEALRTMTLPHLMSLDRAHIQEVSSGQTAWRAWTDAVVPGRFQVATTTQDVAVHWRIPEPANTKEAVEELRIAPGSAKILSQGETFLVFHPVTSELSFYTRGPDGRTSSGRQATPIRLEAETVNFRLLDSGSGRALLVLGLGADGLVTEAHGITRQADGRWISRQLDLPQATIVPRDAASVVSVKGWRWIEPSDEAPHPFATLVPVSDRPAAGWTMPESLTDWASAPRYRTTLVRLSAAGAETTNVEVVAPDAILEVLTPAPGSIYAVVRIGASVATLDTVQGQLSLLQQYAQTPQNIEVLRSIDDKRIAIVVQDHPDSGYRAQANLLAFDGQKGYKALGCRHCALEVVRPDRPPRPYSTTTLDYLGIDTPQCLRIISFHTGSGDGSILDMPTGPLKAMTALKDGQETAPVLWVSPGNLQTEVYDGRRAQIFGKRCKGE